VPKATVNEDGHFGTRKDNVSATAKAFEWRYVDPVAQTRGV
jgi:hypothetical protein